MRRIGAHLDKLLTGVLVACAILVTVLFVRREIAAPSRSQIGARAQAAVRLSDVQDLTVHARRLNAASGDIRITVLSDFECPACRRFHRIVKEFAESRSRDVVVAYLHFPLDYHRLAVPAARASECAHRQDQFASMADALFEHQDSLGAWPWSAYAKIAHVPSLPEFERCMDDRTPMEAITAGRATAERIGAMGTPTVLVNEWMLSGIPTVAELDSIASELAPRSHDRQP